MPKNVEIPGVGVVEFPDTMSDDDIGKAIQKSQGTPAPAAPVAQAAQPASPLASFGQEHEQLIRTGLGLLPVAGSTAGAILAGTAGIPGGPPGMLTTGTAGLAAGSGFGQALENLGLQLFDLDPEPGFLAKAMGANPRTPTGQTLSVIEEMAKTAAVGKTIGLFTPGGREAMGAAVRKHGPMAAKIGGRMVLRGKLGPFYDLIEYFGIRLPRKGTPQMVTKQLERDPVFVELGATVSQRAGVEGGTPTTPIMDALAKAQPAPRPLYTSPLGATVGRRGPGTAAERLERIRNRPAPRLRPPAPEIPPLEIQPVGATVRRVPGTPSTLVPSARPPAPEVTPFEIQPMGATVRREAVPSAPSPAPPAARPPAPEVTPLEIQPVGATVRQVPATPPAPAPQPRAPAPVVETPAKVKVVGVGPPAGGPTAAGPGGSRHVIQYSGPESGNKFVDIETLNISDLRSGMNRLARELMASKRPSPVKRATLEAMKKEVEFRVSESGGGLMVPLRHAVQYLSESGKKLVDIESMGITHLRHAMNRLARSTDPEKRVVLEAMKREVEFRVLRSGGLTIP